MRDNRPYLISPNFVRLGNSFPLFNETYFDDRDSFEHDWKARMYAQDMVISFFRKEYGTGIPGGFNLNFASYVMYKSPFSFKSWIEYCGWDMVPRKELRRFYA